MHKRTPVSIASIDIPRGTKFLSETLWQTRGKKLSLGQFASPTEKTKHWVLFWGGGKKGEWLRNQAKTKHKQGPSAVWTARQNMSLSLLDLRGRLQLHLKVEGKTVGGVTNSGGEKKPAPSIP